MSGYPRLDETGLNILAEALADATKLQGVIKVCETEAEWNQKTQAEKDDPNIYWFLPWRTTISGEIDDSTTALDKVWSSQKVNSENTALKAMVTDDYVFSPTKAYVAGDWLIHNNILYEVITACTGVTPPNATYYDPITLHDLQSRISNIFKKGSTTATDFNNIIDTGVYWINLSTTSGNKPPTTAPYGVLEVFQSYDGRPLQRFTIYNTNVIGFKTYVRMCVNSSWSSWVLYSSESDVSTPTITSGTSNFTMTTSYAYRQGNHIHAEVYGTYGTDITTASQVPFFTISGIQAPSAMRTVGTVIIMDASAKPTLVTPALARLGTNKYIYQHATSTLSSGQRLGFIVDFYDN